MATLRLFAAAREAAGTGRDHVPGATIGDVLDEADRTTPVGDDDEVAVLPPVSGGAR